MTRRNPDIRSSIHPSICPTDRSTDRSFVRSFVCLLVTYSEISFETNFHEIHSFCILLCILWVWCCFSLFFYRNIKWILLKENSSICEHDRKKKSTTTITKYTHNVLLNNTKWYASIEIEWTKSLTNTHTHTSQEKTKSTEDK